LLTIAWHQAINRRRSLTRMWRRMVEPKGDPAEAGHESMIASIAASGPTPEQAALQRQLRGAIRDAIRSLTPTLRDALLLAQSGDYSYAEIGARLRAPTGTIKWRVSQARQLVRRRLRDRGYGDGRTT
jgi:RNA polymerase sigma-70 factor (ECF subfamily)